MGLTRIRAEQISDIDYKQAVRAIQTTNVTLAGGAPSSVDGVSLVASDRVLVVGQSTGSENGIYQVQTLGTGSDGTWVRTSDANSSGEIEAGMIIMVTEGLLYADTQWKLTTNNPIVIGTTALTFVINILSAVGGANTEIQYNNSGTLGASANLTWNGAELYVNGLANVTGNVNGHTANFTSVVGNLLTAAQTGITSLGVLDSLSVTGNIAAGNLAGTSIAGTLTTATQTNITSVGQLTSLNVTGNVVAGNVSGSGLTGTLATAAQPNITSVGTLSSLTVTGNISGGNLLVTNNIVDSGALEIITGSNGNITLSPNGTGTIVANKDLRNGQANGVGNIGSSTGYFNTVFAKATSAQYADLAEVYLSDRDYIPGTVVVFGGQKEITQSTAYAQMSIAGVISTHPAHVMNAGAAGLPVALQGRVPCRVTGTIRKGDLVTSSEVAGVATRLDPADWVPGSVIGKALEDHEDGEGVIEVVVGRV